MHASQTYPSDLTSLEWKLLEPLIPKPKSGGRPIAHTRRAILNAIFYLNRTGCQWSMLPKDFPPKSTVFDYFSAWRKSGLWERLNDQLRVKVRVAEGRKPSPTAAILLVPTDCWLSGCENRGSATASTPPSHHAKKGLWD